MVDHTPSPRPDVRAAHTSGGVTTGDSAAEESLVDVAEDVSLLAWLQTVADRPGQDVATGPVRVPVAWIGRTSTEDQQNPTLSLPRQLASARRALPEEMVIVAHFYDV